MVSNSESLILLPSSPEVLDSSAVFVTVWRSIPLSTRLLGSRKTVGSGVSDDHQERNFVRKETVDRLPSGPVMICVLICVSTCRIDGRRDPLEQFFKPEMRTRQNQHDVRDDCSQFCVA